MPLFSFSWTFAIHHGTLDGYTKMFDNMSHPYATGPQTIRDCLVSNTTGTCPHVLTDFTPRYFISSSQWYAEPHNEGLSEPLIWTPHKIRILLPSVKLLLMLRDPTKRLFSSYRYFKKSATARSQEDFHRRAQAQIHSWNKCVQMYSTRQCLFDIESQPQLSEFWSDNGIDQIRVGFYSLYLKEWLSVFPRKQLLVINFDVYKSSPLTYTTNYILPFLNLDPYDEESYESLRQRDERAKLVKTDARHGDLADMWPETQTLLDEFYQPYNQDLAKLLADDSFLWGK